jgi:hypothetical protein
LRSGGQKMNVLKMLLGTVLTWHLPSTSSFILPQQLFRCFIYLGAWLVE